MKLLKFLEKIFLNRCLVCLALWKKCLIQDNCLINKKWLFVIAFVIKFYL